MFFFHKVGGGLEFHIPINIPTLYLDQQPKMYRGGRGVEKLGPSQTVKNLTGNCTRKKNPKFRLGGRPTSSSEVLQMQTSS